MSRGRIAQAVIALGLAGTASSAHEARADDRATAQQLFQQAKEAMRVGDFAQACPKFEAAAQLTSTLGVRLNLADCWVKLGRTASAWAKFDEALGMAERSGDSIAADLARKGRAAVEPQLVYLSVVVPTEARVTGLDVTRDGEKLPPAAWGVSIPVDPGEHEIAAVAPGRKRWSGKQSVAGAGAKASLTVPALEVEEAPAAVVIPPVVPPPETNPGRGSTQRLVGWVTGGAGAVGLVVGVAMAVDALAERGEYRSGTSPNGQSCLTSTCQSESHAAYTAGNVATIGIVAGGTLLAAGVVLLLTAPSKPQTSAAHLSPLLGPRTAGLGFSTDW